MLTEEQKKAKAEYKKNKKIKKWRRRSRCRFLKNLLIWFVGFISSLAIVGGSLYVAVGVVPLSNFVGNDETVVSNDIADISLLAFIQNLDAYTVADLPVLEDALTSVLSGLGMEDLITIDNEKISSIQLSSITNGEFTNSFINAISFDGTFSEVSSKLDFSLGDFGNLSIFTTYELVENKPTTEEYTDKNFNHSKYYYLKETGETPDKNVYAPAFKNNAYAQGVDESTPLYHPALNDVPVLDFFVLLSDGLDRLKVKDMVNTLGGGTDNSIINKILGDTTIGNIGSFDHKTIILNDLLPVSENGDLYDILKDLTKKDDPTLITVGDLDGFETDELRLTTVYPNDSSVLWQILEQAIDPQDDTLGITLADLKNGINLNLITLETVLPNDTSNANIWSILTEAVTSSNADGKIRIGDLSGFNVDNVKLETVLTKDTSNAKNVMLWNILNEAVTSSNADGKIRITDLKTNFDVGKVKLKTVVTDAGDNKVLSALLKDENTTIDNVAVKLNGLKLKEIYGINCFTTDPTKTVDTSLKYSHSKVKDEFDETIEHDHYTLDENGTYYISKDAKVWLLLLYKAGEKDSNGNAKTFTCKCLTLSSLQSTIGDAHDCFMNATIKILVDSGILKENTKGQYLAIHALTVQQVFDTLASQN